MKSAAAFFIKSSDAASDRLHLPITTQAERDLFMELLPEYQKGAQINFKGILGAFNLAFSNQVMTKHGANVEPEKMIFSKTLKHVKKYYNQLQHAGRVRENTVYNKALSCIPTPVTPPSLEQTATQLSLKETIDRHQQMAGEQFSISAFLVQYILSVLN